MGRFLGSKNKSSNLYRHKFCKQGHDKDIVGRTTKGGCKICQLWANRKWQQSPEVIVYKKTYHWRTYGILNEQNQQFTLTDYDRNYQIQQGRCKCCNKHQSELKQRLFVEHNHTTGKFRGLVCQGCNIKIGAVESKDYEAVKKYLEENF
jgi:Recombination endonuclease VII